VQERFKVWGGKKISREARIYFFAPPPPGRGKVILPPPVGGVKGNLAPLAGGVKGNFTSFIEGGGG